MSLHLARTRALRRTLAAAGVVAAVGLLGTAATFASGALFLALSKVDPRLATPTAIVDYWHAYAGAPKLRRRLQFSIGISSALFLFVLPLGVLAGTKPRRPLHGAARFATASEIRRAGLYDDGDAPSILIGRHGSRFLALGGQLSVMLSAPTRSGKGIGVVIPNLLAWPDSVVVLDIKGENFAATAGFRARHGQAVFVFAPFDDEARSHRWNPLSAVRTSPLHRVGDLLAIGQVFFPNDGSGTSSEAFFNDQARNLFLGLGLLLLETAELPRTVGEMLRQASGKGRSLRDHLAAVIEQRRTQDTPLSDECVDALHRLISNSENTLSSVVATFNAPLTIFADAVVDAATSADDFRLADVRRRPISVYVCIPPNRLASARPLLNLFFSQLVSLNTERLPQADASLKLQCLLINDEFTAMGRVGVITGAAAFLAGYNLRLLTVVQAMSQLDAVYGDKEARTFATNHGLQILFAPREQRDADEYSAMLGTFTERATSRGRSRSTGMQGHGSVSRNESDQRRPLLLPQEFKELGCDRLVIVAENCKPILGEKIRYFDDPVFTERLLPPPKVPAIDMDLHLARVQQRWRLVEELEPGEWLSVDRLAHDLKGLQFDPDAPAEVIASVALGFFCQDPPDAGGAVEPVADEDGVITDEGPTGQASPQLTFETSQEP